MSEINRIVAQWVFEGDDFDTAFKYDKPKETFPKIWERLNEVDTELSDNFEVTELLFVKAQDSELKFSFDKLREAKTKSGPGFFASTLLIIKLAKDFSVGLFQR